MPASRRFGRSPGQHGAVHYVTVIERQVHEKGAADGASRELPSASQLQPDRFPNHPSDVDQQDGRENKEFSVTTQRASNMMVAIQEKSP